METPVIIAIIIAIVVITVVFLVRDRLTDLFVNGKEGTMQVKAKVNEPVIKDEEPAKVIFKGNKLRGEGEYRMRNAEFAENDVDGTQKLELGYDEPSESPQAEENQ